MRNNRFRKSIIIIIGIDDQGLSHFPRRSENDTFESVILENKNRMRKSKCQMAGHL